jgi:hypothetical protein
VEGDGVCGGKPDTLHASSKLVRIVVENIEGAISEFIVEAMGQGGANVSLHEKSDKLLAFVMSFKSLIQEGCSTLTNPWNGGNFFGVMLDGSKGLLAKTFNNTLGRLFANAFDLSAGKVFPESPRACGKGGRDELSIELPAELRMRSKISPSCNRGTDGEF